VKSFTPITVLVRFPWVIAVHASVPANTFQNSSRSRKPNPVRSLRFLRHGLLGAHQRGLPQEPARIDIVHVPYKARGPAVTDLLSARYR